jgi:hypothetical protein
MTIEILGTLLVVLSVIALMFLFPGKTAPTKGPEEGSGE